MMSYKALATRAAKTFLQAFIAVELASETGLYDVATLEAAGTAGLAAVLSLIQNLLSSAEDKQAKVAADKAYRSRG